MPAVDPLAPEYVVGAAELSGDVPQAACDDDR